MIHAEHLLPSGNLSACRQGCLRDRPTKYSGVGSGELLDRLHFTCYHSFVGVSPGRGSARGGGLVGGISLGSKLDPGLLTLPPDPPKVAAAECGFGLLLWCCLGACCSLLSLRAFWVVSLLRACLIWLLHLRLGLAPASWGVDSVYFHVWLS